ncbi:MAG: 6-bladed beta-propeller [Magnetococcales bacterium]|nr:6-bladed beta-propeller [Magnetococcales bacterium]
MISSLKSYRCPRWFWSLGLVLLLLAGCKGEEGVVTEAVKALVFPEPPDTARFYYERTLYGAKDVQPTEVDEDLLSLREMLTGDASPGGGEGFGKPFGVAAAKGRIYVGDTVNRTVMMLDPAQGRMVEIGKEDPGVLAKPMGLRLDAAGNLYVMDGTRKEVLVYDRDGKYQRAIGHGDSFDHPSSVAVNPQGTRLYALDTGAVKGKDENHSVRVYDIASGKHLFNIGKRGDKDGEFNLARDLEFGPDGLLYVVDGGNFRVQVFDQDGKFVRKFGAVGRRLGQFARPKGIAIDKENNLYISDASHANFQIFDKEGQLLMFIGSRGKESERAKYLLPSMIALDEDGRVYMVDQGFRKVEVFRPARLKEEEGSLARAFQALNKLKAKPKQKKG